MKTTDLAKVRATLWSAADELRANSKLTPGQYRDPVLDLVFLAYAENRFEAVRGEVEAKASTRNPATIADYKAKSELSQTLTEEEERSVREGLTEEELAIFDLLTQPDPVLTVDERETVKVSAKKLLEHLHDKLVQDWRRKVATTIDVNSTIRRVLDEGLPEKPYTLDIFTLKVQLVYDHVLTAYGGDGESAYSPRLDLHFPVQDVPEYAGPIDVGKIADDVVARIHSDPAFAVRVAEQLGTSGGAP